MTLQRQPSRPRACANRAAAVPYVQGSPGKVLVPDLFVARAAEQRVAAAPARLEALEAELRARRT